MKYVIAVVLGLSLVACAAKAPRDQARVGALTVGQAVVALEQVERDIRESGVAGYDADAQRKVRTGLRQVAYAARGYERAVRQWQDGVDAPGAVDAARTGLVAALDDFAKVAPQVEAVRIPLLRALAAIRAALTLPVARSTMPPLDQAQTPGLPPQVQLFALAQLILKLVASGRSSVEAIKGSLSKAGATDEELDAIDGKLTEIINRLDAEAEQDKEPA